ncbi:hypothetical protein M427DRAFT_41229 [Gonapodya prolifera JEL478]|uniref:Cns1/TTC4 wheel domain-containing protein n=1 Tax=Gonapodya prolifera (strain JEL478) TaxID=1344416 RepID=A0A139AUM0_GONPJ|nr:hypothetical protein M427DRAFT_41229 [Gonapodya prolifera JEL478]|eukprot:KXS20440.1 hypothetical protein M427DRAFT_41229 [Gonapodya prolifera JEL478]
MSSPHPPPHTPHTPARADADDDDFPFPVPKPDPSKANLSADEWVAELQQHPFFMTHLPSDTKSNSYVTALQEVLYDGTPDEIATNFKTQGNEAYRAGRSSYPDAITFYSKGIAASPTDSSLLSVLYANRAAVHLELGNHRSAAEDASRAVQADASNVKAWYRGARARLGLEDVVEAERLVEEGLKSTDRRGELSFAERIIEFRVCPWMSMTRNGREGGFWTLPPLPPSFGTSDTRALPTSTPKLDPANAPIITLRATIESKRADLLAAQRRREERERVENVRAQMVERALKDRGVCVLPSSASASASSDDSHSPAPDLPRPTLDTTTKPATLRLPVLFLYPEHAQTDLVQVASEHDALADHLDEVLAESPPWDSGGVYGAAKVDIWVQVPLDPPGASASGGSAWASDPSRTRIVRVGRDRTVGDVARTKGLVVWDGVLSVVVLPKKGKFTVAFLKAFKERVM